MEVVTNCDHLAKLKYSPTLPYAFTEHSALMLGNVLKSERAIEVSLMVARAFVQLRQMLSINAEPPRKLVAMEKNHDIKFKAIFEALHQLPPRRNAPSVLRCGKKMMPIRGVA